MFTKETQLRITNATTLSITKIQVSEVDNHDWDNNCGPHRSFAGQTIGPNSSMQKREEVRRSASNCPFTMTLHFSDGSIDIFRINQKFAIGDAGANFQHKKKSHDIDYKREGDKTLVITIKHTGSQLQNIEAQKLKNNGNAKLHQKNYEQAIKLFDQALQKATINSTKQDIINQKYNAYFQHGKYLLQEATRLETQHKIIDAVAKLKQAKTKFQAAQSLNKTTQVQKELADCSRKIGDKLFSEGERQEKEAHELFKKAEDVAAYNSAQGKFKEVSVKYEEALKNLEVAVKLDTKLAEKIKTVKGEFESVKQIVKNIEELKVQLNV